MLSNPRINTVFIPYSLLLKRTPAQHSFTFTYPIVSPNFNTPPTKMTWYSVGQDASGNKYRIRHKGSPPSSKPQKSPFDPPQKNPVDNVETREPHPKSPMVREYEYRGTKVKELQMRKTKGKGEKKAGSADENKSQE